MQLSKISVLSLLAAVATTAPVVETVTNYYVTTVIVEGQTSAVNDAPVFSTSATATAAAAATSAEATPSPTTFETSAASTEAAAEASSSSTVADYQQKQADQPASSSTTSSSAAAPSSTGDSGSGGSDFSSQILAEHNAKRALHGVASLSWDDTLASYAQNYADSYDCSGTLTHSGGQYGENLALGYTTTGSVDAWYSEGNGYDYGSGCSVYDHFTQVIWESTTKVGCGFKQCDSYWGTYIICSYDPAGNFVGKCDSQVVPPV